MRLRKNTRGKCRGAYKWEVCGSPVGAYTMWKEKKKKYESASRLRNA